MAKMNMAAVASKVGGYAGGLALAGAVQRYLNNTGKPTLSSTWGPLGMIAAGVYLPGLVGKGNAMVAHAADAIMMKGVNGFLTNKFPNFIAGAEDEMVSGPYDDSVAGYPTSDEVIVSGPYDYDNSDKVSGFTN